MSENSIARLLGIALLVFAGIIAIASGTYVVNPGFRGVVVTLGEVSPAFRPEGFGFRTPFITSIHEVSVRQQTAGEVAECYSSDLQQIKVDIRVLFRIPEGSVVKLFKEYDGKPFESLIAPRVQEALKEVTALESAEQIVKNREVIKAKALDLARKKVGDLLVLEDLVIQDIGLTPQLEHAIEMKMVQEQEASKSRFIKQRAQVEADTAVIKARGEAESIRIRGQALKANPAFIDLQVVDKWNGTAPLVVGGSDKLVVGLQDLQRNSAEAK